MSSPESDCNSNIGGGFISAPLGCSIASSQDFTHDNSDYQWFLDYGYRDGVTHQSILSSLSASYNGIGELSYYEDLAKNIDANLAEVDMESFRAEDIHSLLTYRKENNKKRQDNDLDNSICKSKQLFSPVKESMLSVDSLDLDCYPDDGDIILTCQANKNNYTIAFEGSTVYSDESFYDGQHDVQEKLKQNSIRINNIDDVVKRKALEVSMSRSDTGFTTWSKLKKGCSQQLQRYPSGNNNTSINHVPRHAPHCFVRKSASLPNLQVDQNNPLHVSQAISTSTVDSYGKMRTLLPMCPMPISTSDSDSPAPIQNSNSSNEPQLNPPSFNLVKLFIKQKSSSTDTCMDVSSGCWPSDSSSSVEQRQRKKSMNDSGKGSALSRHDEDIETDFQYDSLDVPSNNHDNGKNNVNKSNDLYREVFDSPSHRNYKEFNLNIRNYPKHIFSVNNNNSMDKDSLKETNKSLSDASRTSDNITQVFTKTSIPMDMITRSIQTSVLLKDSVKIVPPSFLAQLNQNNKVGEKRRAPVYVIYPSYALPDLGFVKTHQSDIILSPMGYKEAAAKKQRPVSLADVEDMKKKQYKHVIDWKSLGPLLPLEYRKMLKHIPEIDATSKESISSQRPMFCMSPPIRRHRPSSCDCASYCTSSSGSSQQPSSGFRGSSTLLTDSEFDGSTGNNDPLKNLYVYQYDNGRIADDSLERPPTGKSTPRGILRRNSTKTKSKRNSMFEENDTVKEINDKRRSLQEPYYACDTYNIIEDYLAELNAGENVERRLNNSRVSSYRQYYPDQTETSNKLSGTVDARSRAKQFLSNVPKSELKYYAEIANILETIENTSEPYDRNKLRNEVSRALSQKKVSFNRNNSMNNNNNNPNLLCATKEFSTPPNSPNISIAALRMEQKTRRSDQEKQDKIQSNRFKRLQIQWELLSKEASVLEKELVKETRSGGSTPTSAGGLRSRIPRPVSYPTTKVSPQAAAKTLQSPSKLVPPKKYGISITSNAANASPRPRTPSKLYNTPKKTAPVQRNTARCPK
ncbi:hypothetical protein HA402_003450 [Bradysia odoriphaga]|nr:hypothetical protein HA402_003450 [Bradysia odoriphaga]